MIISTFAANLVVVYMSTEKKTLSTLEIIRDAEVIFHRTRWKFGIVYCPYCGSMHIVEYGGYHYRCLDCKRKFSDRTRSIMHHSKLSVTQWVLGIYYIFTDNFTSCSTLAVRLGCNVKSVWLMKMKLDYLLPMERYELEGMIAQDEMHVGGCLSNYHYERKLRLLRERHLLEEDRRNYTKTAIYTLNSELTQPVFGMTTADTTILYATPNPVKRKFVVEAFRRHVKGNSIAVSDESRLYKGWEKRTGTPLYTNNHHNNQYRTKEGYTSNAIENRFSWYKRGFAARVVHCKYHQLYLNEWCFRYNTRHLSHMERFEAALGHTINQYVTYKQIREYKAYKLPEPPDPFEEAKLFLDNDFVESVTIKHRTYTRKDLKE